MFSLLPLLLTVFCAAVAVHACCSYAVDVQDHGPEERNDGIIVKRITAERCEYAVRVSGKPGATRHQNVDFWDVAATLMQQDLAVDLQYCQRCKLKRLSVQQHRNADAAVVRVSHSSQVLLLDSTVNGAAIDGAMHVKIKDSTRVAVRQSSAS